jgi:uncharacterized protein YaeQ
MPHRSDNIRLLTPTTRKSSIRDIEQERESPGHLFEKLAHVSGKHPSQEERILCPRLFYYLRARGFEVSFCKAIASEDQIDRILRDLRGTRQNIGCRSTRL